MKHAPEFLKLVEDVRKNIREMNAAEVQSMLTSAKPFTLIDVREDNEWDRGHIPNALHLGRGIIERDIEATIPDKNTLLVLYCGGGYRSALAAESLQKMGYTQVYSMWGGWREWNEKWYVTAI